MTRGKVESESSRVCCGSIFAELALNRGGFFAVAGCLQGFGQSPLVFGQGIQFAGPSQLFHRFGHAPLGEQKASSQKQRGRIFLLKVEGGGAGDRKSTRL